MRIEYEGESYEFDMGFKDITVKQAIKIEKYLGCPIAEFGQRIAPEGDKPADMEAIQCLGWLILHGGRGVPIEDTDFKIRVLTEAIAAAVLAESKPEDPTPPAASPVNGNAPASVAVTVP